MHVWGVRETSNENVLMDNNFNGGHSYIAWWFLSQKLKECEEFYQLLASLFWYVCLCGCLKI